MITDLSPAYLSRAETALLITTLIYFLMNGAQIFETFVIVPKWTVNPPLSFQIFKDPYALDLKTFWIVLHSIHEITFITSIALCWKIDLIRNGLIFLFFIHFAVRIWTLIYFAPHIIKFQKIANGEIFSEDLFKKTKLWKSLNYIRVSLFVLVSLGLIAIYINLIHSNL